jgi:hypothetical protein
MSRLPLSFDPDPTTAGLTLLSVLLLLVLHRLGRFLRKWIAYILDWIFWTSSRFLRRSLSSRLTLRRYCRLELNSVASKFLQVPGGPPLETDEVFVPLLLDEGRGGDRGFSHSTLLEAGTRIRVLGDPGSGKSSLIKRVYRDACREALRSPKKARFPIRIELKDFVPPDHVVSEDALLEWGLEFLRTRATTAATFEMDECYVSYRDNGGLLLLLDGLDEVPGTAYDRTAKLTNIISTWLERKTDRNVVVLTMRTQLHRQVSSHFDATFPRALHIRSFTPNDIFRFLTQWPFEQRRAASDINRIYSDLTDRPTLRDMCGNPLVLAMYVASDQRVSDPSELPETRTSFYSQVVDELLIARRGRQLGASHARTALRRQREEILARLALEHLLDVSEPANSLSWQSAVDIATNVLNQPERATVEGYLRDLSTQTGLFEEEREGESLRFIHLTFCEFLAAQEAAHGRSNGWSEVLAAHWRFQEDDGRQSQARLAEVIPFTAGLLSRVHLADTLRDVAELGDSQIVARCFLETQGYDHEEWSGFAESELQKLAARPSDQWNTDWLTRLHLLSTAVRESERWAQASSSHATKTTSEYLFRHLVGADERKLVRIFASYATNDPAASFRLAEVCGVDLLVERPDLLVSACADPPFLALALERAERADAASRWPLIFAEAGLRFEIVAETLSERHRSPEWEVAVLTLPREDRWAVDSSRNHYSDCLSLGCSQERAGQQVTLFPLTRVLTHVRSPGTLLPLTLLSPLGLILWCAIIGFVFWQLLLSGQHGVGGTIAVLPVFFITYFVGMQFALYPLQRNRLYRRLINLAAGKSASLHEEKQRSSLLSYYAEAARGPTLFVLSRLILRRPRHSVRLLERLRTAAPSGAVEPVGYKVQEFHDGGVLIERTDEQGVLLLNKRGEVLSQVYASAGRSVAVEADH